jgi:hypothetical protein
MVQSADVQSGHKKYLLRMFVEMIFQWHRKDYRQTADGSFGYFHSIPTESYFITEECTAKNPAVRNNPLTKLKPSIVISRLKSLHTLQLV